MANAPTLNEEFLRQMGLDDEEIAIIIADNCPNCEPVDDGPLPGNQTCDDCYAHVNVLYPPRNATIDPKRTCRCLTCFRARRDHNESQRTLPTGFDDSSPCCGALVFRGECQFCGGHVGDGE